MSEFTAMKDGYDVGIREGWLDALDYVLEVLNEEIDYQEESVSGTTHTASAMYRLHTIFSSRRKEWMLSGQS